MKENENNNKFIVCNWLFSLFCMTAIIAYGFNIGAVLMVILGVASLPIKPIKQYWEKLPQKQKWLRPLILGILFVVFVCMLPSETVGTTDNDKNTVSQVETKKKNDEAIETIKPTEKTTESPKPTSTPTPEPTPTPHTTPSTEITLSVSDIPAYAGSPYVAINNNTPTFAETDLSTSSYEYYSELDGLGRCGVVYACVGKDLMPTEERGEIGDVKPSGWNQAKYAGVVDGNYLYNRCHLIGYQLSGENANTKNLITGTRYLNIEGMLPFENMVADYVKETGNHVMYRVTPIFDGNNPLASGVQMEAISVEDNGAGIMFNVYCYNVQPGVNIDYTNGNSNLVEGTTESSTTNKDESATNNQTVQESEQQEETSSETQTQGDSTVIGNKNTKAFHRPSCSRLPKAKNSVTFNSRDEAMAAGYNNPCAYCNP